MAEPELETLIDARTTSLVRELDASSSSGDPGPGAGAGPEAAPQSLPQQGRAAIGAFLGVGGGTGSAPSSGGGMAAERRGGRGQVSVQFMEKTRRRKIWYKGDEEVCWESWTVRVTVAEPRTESGMFPACPAHTHTLSLSLSLFFFRRPP